MLTRFSIEHTECEYKREVEHTKTKSWLKSVSAFANGISGMLIFGIDDETRKPSPIADVQSEIEFISNCIIRKSGIKQLIPGLKKKISRNAQSTS